MPAPTTIPTGKKNMLGSLRKYLTAELAPTKILFEQYQNVEEIPSISFQDVGVPNLGGHAFEDYVGERDNGHGAFEKVFGKVAQTMVEFNILTTQTEDQAAVRDLYIMRDRLEYALMYSGRLDEGVLIMPRIALLDFDAAPAGEDTGATVWAPMEKDSVWIENYIGTDPERAGVKRLRVLVRFYWHLLRP